MTFQLSFFLWKVCVFVCGLTCVWGGVEWWGGCDVLSCPGSSWGWGHAPCPGVPAVPQPLLSLPTLPLCVLHGPVGTLTHTHTHRFVSHLQVSSSYLLIWIASYWIYQLTYTDEKSNLKNFQKKKKKESLQAPKKSCFIKSFSSVF